MWGPGAETAQPDDPKLAWNPRLLPNAARARARAVQSLGPFAWRSVRPLALDDNIALALEERTRINEVEELRKEVETGGPLRPVRRSLFRSQGIKRFWVQTTTRKRRQWGDQTKLTAGTLPSHFSTTRDDPWVLCKK